ncbi:MAG: hypothetical protein OEW58_13170 [Gammaproteobacteria bacterium]|nr:hypothetical protein [Gammaproteobacteria bacterium]
MERINNKILFASLLLFLPSIAFSGTLDDFERDSTTPQSSEPKKSSSRGSCNGMDCSEDSSSIGDEFTRHMFSGLFDAVARGVGFTFSHGTRVTLDRTSWYQRTPGITPRKTGSPLLPTFRASGTWQSVYPDLEGRDFSVEVGHSLFSAQIRKTQFVENTPADSLTLSYGIIYYRLSYGNNFEINFGLGRSELTGNHKNIGTTFSAPITWQFADDFAFSLWQSYSSINRVALSDIDYSFMYVKNGFSTSLGYRSVSNPVSELSGPYVGLSYFY